MTWRLISRFSATAFPEPDLGAREYGLSFREITLRRIGLRVACHPKPEGREAWRAAPDEDEQYIAL